jgi:hypothetical protein
VRERADFASGEEIGECVSRFGEEELLLLLLNHHLLLLLLLLLLLMRVGMRMAVI